MDKNLLFFLSLALLLSFGSCEKDADNIDLPEAEPKLVVYSYLNPSDSIIKVDVSKSIPFFGKGSMQSENEIVIDAEVLLSSDLRKSIRLPYVAGKRAYQIPNNSDFPLLAGYTYTLSVTAPGGLTCVAKTTIPLFSAQEIAVSLDSIEKVTNGIDTTEYLLRTSWRNSNGRVNYYHHSVGTTSENDSIIGGEELICNDVLTDDGRENKILSKSCTFNKTIFHVLESSNRPKITVYLLTTDLAYYKYHQTYYRYDDSNPFAQPVQIYSNVNGGLGCFGSFVLQSFTL